MMTVSLSLITYSFSSASFSFSFSNGVISPYFFFGFSVNDFFLVVTGFGGSGSTGVFVGDSCLTIFALTALMNEAVKGGCHGIRIGLCVSADTRQIAKRSIGKASGWVL